MDSGSHGSHWQRTDYKYRKGRGKNKPYSDGLKLEVLCELIFVENCVCILTCLSFGYLQNALLLMWYTYRDIYSIALTSFWTRPFWCLFMLLPFFVSPLPHRQNISLWGLFSTGKHKKVTQGKTEWIERVGHGDHAIFGQKLLTAQCRVDRCAHKSPIMKWANALTESSKKFTEAKHSLSQQHQLGHWYRWVPRTLT